MTKLIFSLVFVADEKDDTLGSLLFEVDYFAPSFLGCDFLSSNGWRVRGCPYFSTVSLQQEDRIIYLASESGYDRCFLRYTTACVAKEVLSALAEWAEHCPDPTTDLPRIASPEVIQSVLFSVTDLEDSEVEEFSVPLQLDILKPNKIRLL